MGLICSIQDDEDNADNIKSRFQSLLGSEHEVMSLSKMMFSAPSADVILFYNM